MTGPGTYPAEVRERAVRMALERRYDYSSQWAKVSSIAAKCDMTAETPRKSVRRADPGGERPHTRAG